MINKTTIESATTKIGEQETGSYLQLGLSRAPKKNHDALAQLEKYFVQWSMHSPGIEKEAAGGMDRLAKLSKEIGSGGNGKHKNKAYTITGPEELSYYQVSEIISDATMQTLPWIFIPAVVVPVMLTLHGILLYLLREWQLIQLQRKLSGV
jgi:hypothetical protein